MSWTERVERTCRTEPDERALRAALISDIRAVVPFDAYAWLLTDPETCVGSAPLAETPSLADLPALIRLKYLTPTNRWTTLEPGASATLIGATGGERSRSLVWEELLRGYGIDDVVSAVFRDRYGCWGFLDLWRRGAPFSATECDLLDELVRVATPALRRSLLGTFAHGRNLGDLPDGPVVLLLSDDLESLTQTPRTDSYLRALLPTEADRAPVPAGAYNVGAQLLAQECGVDDHPSSARVHLPAGAWVTLRAARMPRAPGASSVSGASIAVTIEPANPLERTALYARVAGLSERESDLLNLLVGGSDTRELADRLFMSGHTVQDHLKSIFAKAGVNSRRVLIARATGAA